MMQSTRSGPGYGVAILSTLLATAARLAFDPLLGNHLPYVTYFLAIVITAWYGGLRPSLLALALGAVAATFLFVPPRGSPAVLGAENLLGMGLYVFVGATIAVLGESQRVAQRRAEASAREASGEREWLRVTLASIGDAVIATDDRGRVTFLNGVAESLTGWRQEEAVGQPLESVFRIINEASRQPVENPVTVVLREGAAVGLANHTILIARDGAERPIADSAAPIREAQGRVRGVVLVFRDITARRRAEAEAERIRAEERAAHERTRSILDSITDSFLAFDRDWRITDINRQAESVFGRTREELIGKVMWEEYPQAIDGEFYRQYHRAMAEQVPVHFEAKSAITERWSEAHAYPSPDGLSVFLCDITERKLAEEELRRKQAELTDFVENAAIGLHWVGPDGTILWANQAELDLLEYTREEYIGRNIAQFHADPDVIADILRRLTDDEELHGYEARLRAKDGSIKYVLISSNVYREMGQFHHSRCFTRDITQRRLAEEEARERLESWRVTLASIGDAVVVTDPAGLVTFMNPVAQDLCGWAAAEALGRPLEEVFRIVNEATGLPAENPVERVIWEGHVVGLANHTVLIARDGARRPIEDSAAPIRDAAGDIKGIVLVFHDVTEERRAEELNERLAAIVESSDDAIVGKDLDGVIRTWNRAAERMLGYSPEEAIGQHVSMLMPPEFAEDPMKILTRVRRGERVEHYETRRRRKDGSIIDVSLTVSPVRNGQGEIIGVSKIARDITDRKRAEREAREAREAVEAANRAKDNFLAALSHELRTPLTPVLVTISALERDQRVPADLRDDLGMARRNVEMEVRLIDDLLDLTRITQGKLALRRELVDLHSLIHHAVNICRAEIEAKGLDLRLDLGARRSWVRGDGARLQQVMWNLVKNAVKFTPTGGCIGITTEDAADDRLVARVADTGIGITPEVLPKIFDAFEQGGPAITRQFGGLGLGLAISKALVEAHGGTLTAASEGGGRGATFTVEVGDSELPDEASCVPMGRADGQGRPLRILLVDDHRDTLRVMSRMLVGLGHDVTTAESVATALEVAGANSFDLLVSDLGLPDGSGLDLMRRLRPMPGIALTGYGMESDVTRCLEAGFAAHLTKPIDSTKLEETIQGVAPKEPALPPAGPTTRPGGTTGSQER